MPGPSEEEGNIDPELVARMLKYVLKDRLPGERIVSRPPHQLRKLLKEMIAVFGLSDFNFQWYSLRRGGASYDFSRHGSMEATLLRGRWESVKSARVYVNEALAASVYIRMSEESKRLLSQAANHGYAVFRQSG